MVNQQSYLITGGSSFLGKRLALYLSSCNTTRIFITSRRDITIEIEEILKNTNVKYLPNIDLLEQNDIDVLHAEVNDFFEGRFNVINCLGYFPSYDLIEDINILKAKSIFEGNVLTLYAVAHKIIPLMTTRGGGHFIGFSTHTLYQSYPLMSAFSASKAAVETLIKCISNEYLSKGIIANIIAPATLKTEIEINMKPNGDHDNWLNLNELCEVVNNLILHSNNYVNGTVLHVYKHSDSYFNSSYYDRIK